MLSQGLPASSSAHVKHPQAMACSSFLSQSSSLCTENDLEASGQRESFRTGLQSPPISDHGGPTTPKRRSYHPNSTNCTIVFCPPPSPESEDLSPLTSTFHGSAEDDVFSPSSLCQSSQNNESFLDKYRSPLSDPFPFPISPPAVHSCISPKIAANNWKGPTLNRRSLSAERNTPPITPDRFIGDRNAFSPSSRAFYLSKASTNLTAAEKLFRQNSSTPDPFIPQSPTRVMEARPSHTSDGRNLIPIRSPPRTILTNVQDVPQSVSTIRPRSASIGTIWNVGGNMTTSSPNSGPVQAIPDGRGRTLGSGTNAPMYTTNFLVGSSNELDNELLEARIAVALEIDQTNRLLNTSRSPERGRSASCILAGIKRKVPDKESRTRWIHGEWVQEYSPSRKQQNLHSIICTSLNRVLSRWIGLILARLVTKLTFLH